MNFFVERSRTQTFSKELHALRGVAALVVLLVHFQHRLVQAWPDWHVPDIFNGSAAVTYFFVLSGLVVGMSLARVWGEQGALLTYGVRRVFRIMPLMALMATIGSLYLFFVNPHMAYSLYDIEKYGDFDLKRMLASYIGYSMKANPPSWSIFVELVASVLIPVFLIMGRNIWTILVGGIMLFAFSLWDMPIKNKFNIFMLSFYIGLTVLVWGPRLAEKCRNLPKNAFWGLVAILALAFYMPRVITQEDYYGNPWIIHWETLTVAPLVAIILYLPERFSALTRPVFQYLGDVSYSLYLTHVLVMVVLYNLLASLMGVTVWLMPVFTCVALPLVFMIAHLSYNYIEKPGIQWGKKALDMLGPKKDTK
ncbi:MAG: acyltransferase [Pseudobdellovibrionaceae bacterium]|jgi:peptidoglycan/LPS O-acetylase OafA/YrhL|nr:acyltransferase [Pseudobdellovibrionaceae bacterium]